MGLMPHNYIIIEAIPKFVINYFHVFYQKSAKLVKNILTAQQYKLVKDLTVYCCKFLTNLLNYKKIVLYDRLLDRYYKDFYGRN